MGERQYMKYLAVIGAILLLVALLLVYAFRQRRVTQPPPAEIPSRPITQEEAIQFLPPAPQTPAEEAEVKKEQTEFLKTLPPPPKTNIQEEAVRKQQEELLRLLPPPAE